MKSAGKARSNGLYRHIRTSKEIIRNLLNYCPKNLKRYLMYFGVSTDSCISFPFIADCQTNSDLAASVVLTATYCITN